MKVCIVTPAPRGSRAGNRVTANRWARILRELGHRVTVSGELDGRRCDVLVALHAVKSAAVVERFRSARPDAPLVVAVTGTDLYRDLPRNGGGLGSLEAATRLVVLQDEALRDLPQQVRGKARVIHQSATAPAQHPGPRAGVFEVCVLGHLRAEKDPFRCALATRLLPRASRIRVLHVGKALDQSFAARARAEERRNPRYRWLGELPRWRALRTLARCRLLVLSSRMEGGANALSEALAARVPVLATRIPGSTGILGDDYPGLFPVGDTRALAALLQCTEAEPGFFAELTRHCRERARLVRPARERDAWRALLAELEA